VAKDRTGSDGLGPLEAEVMDIIWAAAEPVSVREVVDRLNHGRGESLAYTTVMTVMSRLAGKDVLARTRAGRGFVYEATTTDVAGIAVRGVIGVHGEAAIAHFLEAARADPAILERLRALLKEEAR
jgi:predicted transcriptional regulator